VPLIDADEIAREERAGLVTAARLAIMRTRAHISAGESFAIETTLAGQRALRVMKEAHAAGFIVNLAFLGTEDVEINLERIRDRVTLGGHDVPEIDVRRRYARGLKNLPAALELADRVTLFDNSLPCGLKAIAIRELGSRTLDVTAAAPWWVAQLLRQGIGDHMRTYVR